MGEKIYVVFGSSGEYSDRREWPVIAFTTEAAAQERVINAEKRAKELYVQYARTYTLPPNSNEFDSFMQMDYTGTSYYLVEVELVQP